MGPEYSDIRIAGSDTAQPLSLNKRLRIIKQFLLRGNDRFLDCGCGAGDYVFALVEQFGLDAYGIEYEAKKVEQGNANSKHGRRVLQGDLQTLDLRSNDWDYAMLNEVLEHVPDEAVALREVHRILKPEGLLFIFSPNRWFPFEAHGVHWKRSGRSVPHWFPFIPYIPLGLGNRFFKYWARNYWQQELRKLATSAGFRIVEAAFIWPTFEGISGRQPRAFAPVRPLLRKVADTLEFLPFVTRFGVSQVLVCRKVGSADPGVVPTT